MVRTTIYHVQTSILSTFWAVSSCSPKRTAPSTPHHAVRCTTCPRRLSKAGSKVDEGAAKNIGPPCKPRIWTRPRSGGSPPIWNMLIWIIIPNSIYIVRNMYIYIYVYTCYVWNHQSEFISDHFPFKNHCHWTNPQGPLQMPKRMKGTAQGTPI